MTSGTSAPPSVSSGVAGLSLPRVAEIDPYRILQDGPWPPFAAATLEFQQGWLPEREASFRPGRVQLAATAQALVVLAELSDEHIHTAAVADHQHLWDLGDVFEIFVQPLDGEAYYEFEIASNGCVLQLAYPGVGANRTEGIDRYIRRDRLIESAVLADPANRRWRVAVRIPVEPLLPRHPAATGREWRVACCRYDYDADRRYCLSSTAPLTQPSFHRVAEWSRVLVPGGFQRDASFRI